MKHEEIKRKISSSSYFILHEQYRFLESRSKHCFAVLAHGCRKNAEQGKVIEKLYILNELDIFHISIVFLRLFLIYY